MITFLLSPLVRLAGTLLIGGAIVSGIYWYGHSRGAAAERQATLERSVELLRERNQTDDEVSRMGDRELCEALGGIWQAGLCQ